MNVIKCTNGHFFDGDSYDKCPHCGAVASSGGNNPVQAISRDEKKPIWSRSKKNKEDVYAYRSESPAGNAIKGSTPTEYIIHNIPDDHDAQSAPSPKHNQTLDFWQTPSRSQNGPTGKSEDREPEENTVPEPAPSLQEVVKNASASNEGKTMSYFSSATSQTQAQNQAPKATDPVVGWLVCVQGVHFGESFCIFAGKNSVGRSSENRIIIADDGSISRIKHALIIYEPKKKNFYLQPGDSSGLTYLNGDYITESHILTSRDMIELGDSKFMFIPLCGDDFSWETYITKGE